MKRWADALNMDERQRLPPGQFVIDKLPIMTYGNVPQYIDVERTWDLRIWGEIERPVRLSYADIRALPIVEIVADLHCITHWSKLGTRWAGVPLGELMRRLPPLRPTARFVVAHGEHDFTAELPLEALLDPSAILAYRYEGAVLTPEHGYPLRLVVPSRYFCKSVKWLRGLELLSDDRPGFWEHYGYHRNADPWREERYAENEEG